MREKNYRLELVVFAPPTFPFSKFSRRKFSPSAQRSDFPAHKEKYLNHVLGVFLPISLENPQRFFTRQIHKVQT